MVINLETGQTVLEQLQRADTFWSRFWGLLLRKNLYRGEGLLLTPCRSVHTFFMRFEIDVVYLDSSLRVLAVFPQVKPGRLLPLIKQCRHVLEMAGGTIAGTGLKPGDCIIIS